MNRVYERLKNNDNFKDKLNFNEIENCLTIVLHDYLSLDYFEGNYTSACDEGLINLKRTEGDEVSKRLTPFVTHWHITDDDEALEVINELANGNEIFIDDVRGFKFFKLRVMSKEKFEKKKEKYMAKKYLRIYSGKSIIKRND